MENEELKPKGTDGNPIWEHKDYPSGVKVNEPLEGTPEKTPVEIEINTEPGLPLLENAKPEYRKLYVPYTLEEMGELGIKLARILKEEKSVKSRKKDVLERLETGSAYKRVECAWYLDGEMKILYRTDDWSEIETSKLTSDDRQGKLIDDPEQPDSETELAKEETIQPENEPETMKTGGKIVGPTKFNSDDLIKFPEAPDPPKE